MVRTSYFSSRGYAQSEGVSIAVGMPKGFVGPQAKELCPTWFMVRNGYTYSEYVALITKRGVTPEYVAAKYSGKVLLCWEKEFESCHRSYLVKWLNANGVSAAEIKPERKTGGASAQLVLF